MNSMITTKVVVLTIIVFCLHLLCKASDFSLTIKEDNTAVLKNRFFSVQTLKFMFRVMTEDKKISFVHPSRRNEIVDSIKEIKNTETVKIVELKSKPFSYKQKRGSFKSKLEFYVRLKILKDHPMLFVETKLKNIGDSPVNAYYFWRIMPVYSDNYISKGRFNISKGKLDVEDWVFFPYGKDAKGYGLILNTEDKELSIWTTFPRKNWMRHGWYIRRKAPKLSKDRANNINFIFVTAPSLDKFKEYYENGLKKKILTGFTCQQ